MVVGCIVHPIHPHLTRIETCGTVFEIREDAADFALLEQAVFRMHGGRLFISAV